MPAEQLSGTIVVIIIAIGVQGCIMLTIFAKRQIMRFALRNRRGPHTSLGQGVPKPLRRDIERYLDYVPYIRSVDCLHRTENQCPILHKTNFHSSFNRQSCMLTMLHSFLPFVQVWITNAMPFMQLQISVSFLSDGVH